MKNQLIFTLILILFPLQNFVHSMEKVVEKKTEFKIKYFCHSNVDFEKSTLAKDIFGINCHGQFIPTSKKLCLATEFNLKCPEGEYLFIAAEAGECLPESLNALIIPITSSLTDLLKLCNKSRTH